VPLPCKLEILCNTLKYLSLIHHSATESALDAPWLDAPGRGGESQHDPDLSARIAFDRSQQRSTQQADFEGGLIERLNKYADQPPDDGVTDDRDIRQVWMEMVEGYHSGQAAAHRRMPAPTMPPLPALQAIAPFGAGSRNNRTHPYNDHPRKPWKTIEDKLLAKGRRWEQESRDLLSQMLGSALALMLEGDGDEGGDAQLKTPLDVYTQHIQEWAEEHGVNVLDISNHHEVVEATKLIDSRTPHDTQLARSG